MTAEEKRKEEERQQELDVIYASMTSNCHVSRRIPDHAPKRKLKPHEISRPAWIPTITPKMRELHQFHLDQKTAVVSCLLCQENHAGVFEKRVEERFREERPRASDRPPLPGGRRPPKYDDQIYRDYGAIEASERGGWRQLCLSSTEGAMYFPALPSPLIDFARWLFVSLCPGVIRATNKNPPKNAAKLVKYTVSILERSKPRFANYGLDYPSPEQLRALLPEINLEDPQIPVKS